MSVFILKKLKDLSNEDLDNITEFLSVNINDFILKRIKSKEIVNLDININVNYNEELDLDISVDLELDKFSTLDEAIANEAIDFALDRFDSFLEDNYCE
jgi:hypothetical protein